MTDQIECRHVSVGRPACADCKKHAAYCKKRGVIQSRPVPKGKPGKGRAIVLGPQ